MALTKEQIEDFRVRLEKLRLQYMHAIRGSSADVKIGEENKVHSQHQADQGTDDFVQSVSIEVSSQETQILYQIERALEKIDEGTYGVCDLTGEEIPLKRLDAIPYATMTIAAQEKWEKGQVS
ncbi:MAG: TraR/DksA family transcriptional regulator [Simkaniaceae bacterium]|nr:TraR/DksA family transcriptional regulator [Simkaniaceae bacterium]